MTFDGPWSTEFRNDRHLPRGKEVARLHGGQEKGIQTLDARGGLAPGMWVVWEGDHDGELRP